MPEAEPRPSVASDDKIRHPKILLAFRLLNLKDDSYVLHRGSPRPLAPAPRTRPALHLGAGRRGASAAYTTFTASALDTSLVCARCAPHPHLAKIGYTDACLYAALVQNTISIH